MDGIELDEAVHPLVQRAVQVREPFEVFADHPALFGRLAQEPLRDDVGHVLAGDANLLEAVLDPPEGVGHELEPGIVEEALLDAGHEAEPRRPADLSHLAQEVQVEDERLLVACSQVVEQLVQHEQQALVGVGLLEGGHHRGERVLAVRRFAGRREPVVDVELM